MKKLLFVLLTTTMMFGLCSCGGSDQQESNSATTEEAASESSEEVETEEASTEADSADSADSADDSTAADDTEAASTEPVSADLGDYHVTILSAEQFKDDNDTDSVRFYFDFTNNSDEEVSSYFAFETVAYQDGYELVATNSYYEKVAEADNCYHDILPGITTRCITEYNFKPEGGEIEFTISESVSGDNATMTFDPAALPGRPAEDYTIEPCSSEALVENLPSEGVYDEDFNISITKSEVVDGLNDGEKVIRIYFDFTNNSDEATSFWAKITTLAMQDGIGLESTLASESVSEDENCNLDVQPGDTLTVSTCYSLHDTGSPVAIKVIDYFGDSSLGTTFEVQ